MPKASAFVIPRTTQVFGTWFCALACVVLLTACDKLQNLPFMPLQNPPEEFFDGPYLNMAQAILEEDIPRLQRLAQGQDLSQKGRKGMSLMWFSIVHERFSALQALVELGLNPDYQAAEGIGSALYFAFTSPDVRFLKAILDGGFDPNFYDRPGGTLMLQRATAGTVEHVKLMLAYGTRLNDTDTLGITALEDAISRRKPNIATYLVEQGIDFNTYDINGVTTMMVLSNVIDKTLPGNPIHEQFKDLRDLLIAKGVQWPPLQPEEVREQMRARGEPIGVLRQPLPLSPWPPQ